MIRVVFKTRGHKLTAFKMTGHADAGPYGYDIVCAAVSALSISTVNGLKTVAHTRPTVKQDEQNGGFLEVTTIDPGNDAQVIMKTFLNGMLDIQEGYHQHIQVQMVEQQTH